MAAQAIALFAFILANRLNKYTIIYGLAVRLECQDKRGHMAAIHKSENETRDANNLPNVTRFYTLSPPAHPRTLVVSHSSGLLYCECVEI